MEEQQRLRQQQKRESLIVKSFEDILDAAISIEGISVRALLIEYLKLPLDVRFDAKLKPLVPKLAKLGFFMQRQMNLLAVSETLSRMQLVHSKANEKVF